MGFVCFFTETGLVVCRLLHLEMSFCWLEGAFSVLKMDFVGLRCWFGLR
jgi:hypothetical protein